jgi:hypothetical protein
VSNGDHMVRIRQLWGEDYDCSEWSLFQVKLKLIQYSTQFSIIVSVDGLHEAEVIKSCLDFDLILAHCEVFTKSSGIVFDRDFARYATELRPVPAAITSRVYETNFSSKIDRMRRLPCI